MSLCPSPQSSGAVERKTSDFGKTKLAKDLCRDWPEMSGCVCLCLHLPVMQMRSTVNRKRGLSPHESLTGRCTWATYAAPFTLTPSD